MKKQSSINNILRNYGSLLSTVDLWFNRCLSVSPDKIKCAQGCSECCRGLFDITLLDAWYMKTGFERLEEKTRQRVLRKASKRLHSLQNAWPELERPYFLNIRPDEEWEILMPDDDETPCPLLSDKGECLVYEYRPMTCRLHGIPLVDVSGEVFHDEWCTKNFNGENPLAESGLYWNFSSCFQTEITIFRQLTFELFNQYINELDTFIPLALLMDYKEFDWKEWLKGYSGQFG